jgi:5-methylcytosine-specific restriction enzyme subunit McrC
MTNPSPRVVELTEYIPVRVPREQLSDTVGELLYRRHGKQVALEFPSPKTDGQWELTAQGWVGYIPLTSEITLALRPKVELSNLFRMLEYAYRLQSIHFLEGLVDCKSLEEFYEYLANVLAKRVLDRARKGFYHAYRSEEETLPFIRGRIDFAHAARRPWNARLICHYEEHTADLEENQILVWTLFRIANSGALTERVLPTVRRAYHSLRGIVMLSVFGPGACIGRLYNRLNDDYQPLHALCRFFLEHTGPSHESGDRRMTPFILDMERLYELFVAEWLRAHLPEDLRLNAQERVNIGSGGTLHFDIDLVLEDVLTGQVVQVLDTKYKAPESPSPADLAQVIAYAEAKGCREAALVYPVSIRQPLDDKIGNIRVRSLNFSLNGNLEASGGAFLNQLMREYRPTRVSR